jgi:hypothetical protein
MFQIKIPKSLLVKHVQNLTMETCPPIIDPTRRTQKPFVLKVERLLESLSTRQRIEQINIALKKFVLKSINILILKALDIGFL